MKAEELMKNNLIEFNGYVEKVASFDDSSITSFRDGEGRTYSYISAEPIPLTKEWLLRFGAKDLGGDSGIHSYEIKINGVFFYCDSSNNFTTLESTVKGMPLIKYVHQLQNLYFALIGKELKLKE